MREVRRTPGNNPVAQDCRSEIERQPAFEEDAELAPVTAEGAHWFAHSLRQMARKAEDEETGDLRTTKITLPLWSARYIAKCLDAVANSQPSTPRGSD